MSSYLPSREADLADWALNFNTLINVDPTVYGLTAEQAAEYAARYTAFEGLYEKSKQPTTRTPAVNQGKRDAKRAMIALTRQLVTVIQGQPTTTNEQRAALGITVRDTDPTPFPVPSVSPVLEVTRVNGWTVSLLLHDGMRRRKPEGVKGANLFSFVGEQPPSEIAAWKFEGGTSRTSLTVEFDHGLTPGTKIWLTAFWFNPRLQSGPACAPVATQINYGGLAQAA